MREKGHQTPQKQNLPMRGHLQHVIQVPTKALGNKEALRAENTKEVQENLRKEEIPKKQLPFPSFYHQKPR